MKLTVEGDVFIGVLFQPLYDMLIQLVYDQCANEQEWVERALYQYPDSHIVVQPISMIDALTGISPLDTGQGESIM